MSTVDTSLWFHSEDLFDSIELSLIVQYLAVELGYSTSADSDLVSIDNMLRRFDLESIKTAFSISVPKMKSGAIKTSGHLMAYTYAVLKNNCNRRTM